MTRRSSTFMALEALVALALLAACSSWRPPPADPLEGWREMPSDSEEIREWVRDRSVLQILPVAPAAPNEYATLFDDAGTTAGYIMEHIDADVSNVEVGLVRRHGDVTWVDAAFDGSGARRKVRVSWFAVEGGSQVFRLLAPRADWNSDDLTSFQEYVRHRARQVRLED